jgi:hypothetical protein
MMLVHHNYQAAHQMELNALQKLLVQLMPKPDVHQELELELMGFVSGIQLLPHQLVDQWFVVMS